MSNPVMNAENINFSDKNVDEIYKKIMVLLYNVNNFYALYKDIPQDKAINSKLIIDKWIISRIEETTKNVTENLKNYNTIKACEEIRRFVDELSTWYVRRCRDRFNEGDSQVKLVLGYVLEKLSKIISPVMPFVSEIIYQSVVDKNGSVHLQDWPGFNEKLINKDINEKMQLTRDVVSIALKERDVQRVSLKQPLAKLEVSGVDLSKEYLELIEEEVNVKKVELKKGKEDETKIILDTKITPELEAEGYAREISRKVQALRKNTGLVKDNFIELFILADEKLSKIIEKQKDMIKERTNSKKISIIQEKTSQKFLVESKEKIKENEIILLFNKL
jgi:isoleucyl-tRNA synthetase